MTHSIAALLDHNGPSRRDDRARRLAARLCETPPFRPAAAAPPPTPIPGRRPSLHAPGWVTDIGRRDSAMHLSVDPKVARALPTRGELASSSGCRRNSCAGWSRRSVRRHIAVLSLPEHPPQPDQLLGGVAGVRGKHERGPEAAAGRLPAPAQPLPAGSETGCCTMAHREPGPELQLPPQSLPEPPYPKHRIDRVRQHRARHHLLLRAGAA